MLMPGNNDQPAGAGSPQRKPGPRLSGQNIVCFSTADWDTLLPTNKHQLMRRLARRNRVLYIETIGTRSPKAASTTDLLRIGRRVKRAFEGSRRRENRLWTLSPIVRPDWSTAPKRTINRAAFAAQTGGVVGHFPRPVVWVYSPYAVYLLDRLDPSLVVYHMVDDLSAVPGANAEALRDAEQRLLARADLVFCTERSLFDRARSVNPAARLMPNVADYRHFSKIPNIQEGRFQEFCELPRPRLLFSGNVTPHKVDLALLGRIAKRRSDWQVVIVGPVWEGTDASEVLRKLGNLPNVTMTGHVDYTILPGWLQEADVLLIPYVKNRATRAVFPLKFFEYLSTGRPVVASPLPSLLPYEPAVTLAETTEEWIAAVENSLNDEASFMEQRQVLARRQTWGVRLREMEEEILALLKS